MWSEHLHEPTLGQWSTWVLSQVIAFLFFVLPEAEDTDRHFVDMMECENTKNNFKKKNADNTVMVDWELWLSVTGHKHEGVLLTTLPVWKKKKKTVSTE